MSPSPAIVPRLSTMMFLQFFIWGSWYVSATPFIMDVPWIEGSPEELAQVRAHVAGWTYTVGPIAALVSPLFLGVVADRFFPTQVVLALLHFLGGAVMLLVPTLAGGEQPDANAFLWALGFYMACYMPTLGLTNTLAFHNLQSQEKQFPLVRVFGTLGWIAANVVISKGLEADREATQFYVAGAASMLMAAYCLSLPHTPPPLRGQPVRIGALFGFDALSLMRRPAFAVFVVASFLICIPLAAYYQSASAYVGASGFERPVFWMSFGQWAEVAFMLLMPLFFVRLGVKWMLAVGMAAWVLRYGLFSAAADEDVRWMILAGILLHGICYDFFFVTGQIYVDKAAPGTIRGQAQGFLVLVTQGLGLGIGAQLVSWLVAGFARPDGTYDWASVWLWPAAGAAVILVAFVLLFHERRPPATGGAAAAEPA